jgi:uncharacterized membrane protein (UPF0127 family)
MNFKTHIWFIIGILLAILLVGGTAFFVIENRSQPDAYISSSGTSRGIELKHIEIADTALEQAQGLMNRKDLCPECGMLFIFDNVRTRSFWMKDTLIPLDIIFMDENGEILKIHQNAEPQNEDKRYESEKPAKYTLEINGGKAEEFGLKEGQILDINSLLANAKEFGELPVND